MRSLLLTLALLVPTPAVAQSLSGAAHIVDGDTLVIDETKIRLFGIDAPELDQSCTLEGQSWECGARSKDQLEGLTAGQTVSCRGTETDDHGRLLAICYARGLELNATMVEYGWALAYRRYSNDYIAHEFQARSAKEGLWRSQFDLPEHYRTVKSEAASRSQKRSSAPTSSKTSGRGNQGCTIKGNRSRRGDWIYHLPGMQYYDQTRPEEIFCSEADARAAGYRRSKV